MSPSHTISKKIGDAGCSQKGERRERGFLQKEISEEQALPSPDPFLKEYPLPDFKIRVQPLNLAPCA